MKRPRRTNFLARLFTKFEIGDASECWKWKGTLNRGYGQFTIGNGRRVAAHRFIYGLVNGTIPEGLQLDHLCRNPYCVNPAHLEAVTGRVNKLRAPRNFASINHAKTHCSKGHPFDESNTAVRPTGQRRCKICEREYCRQGYQRRKHAIRL